MKNNENYNLNLLLDFFLYIFHHLSNFNYKKFKI